MALKPGKRIRLTPGGEKRLGKTSIYVRPGPQGASYSAHSSGSSLKSYAVSGILSIVIGILFILMGFALAKALSPTYLICALIGVMFISVGVRWYRKSKK